MLLKVAKKLAYVVLGGLIVFVVVFNPVIWEWVVPPPRPESWELVDGGRHVTYHEAIKPQIVNWSTSFGLPFLLYFGKRFTDWIFDDVLKGKK